MLRWIDTLEKVLSIITNVIDIAYILLEWIKPLL